MSRGLERHGKFVILNGELVSVDGIPLRDQIDHDPHILLDRMAVVEQAITGLQEAVEALQPIPDRMTLIEQAIIVLQEAVEALQPEPEPELVKIAQIIHGLPSNYEIDDIALFDWLSDYETDVTQIVIQEIEGKSVEYWEQFEVIILPYGYSGSSLVNLLASEVPIISVEEGFADDLDLATGLDTFKASTRDFYVRDNTHPITSGLSLGAWVWSGSGFMWTQATDKNGYTEATVLVDNGEVGKDILIVHNTKKYAFFGWYRPSQWPDEGWDMIKKTIEWAINQPLLAS